MATHSSILAWRIPWTEEPGGLHTVSPWDRKESDRTERLTLSFSHYRGCHFLKFTFNWRIMLYNTVLVSAAHQHEPAAATGSPS